MPGQKRAEGSQVVIQQSDCSKNSKSAVDICDGATKSKSEVDNIDYEQLAEKIVRLLKKNVDTSAYLGNQQTQENRIASEISESEENTAGEPVDKTNDCVNSNHVISLSRKKNIL